MSSDESTSTQISAISSKAGNEQNLKPHKPEQWEINLIGNFLLTLYHRLVIGPQNEWVCKKIDVRREFQQFVTPELSRRLKELNGTDNIGTLLHRCDFLFNTPRGSPFYKLKCRSLFDFRNRKLAEQDKRRINDDADSTGTAGPEDILRNLPQRPMPTLQASYEIDEDSPVQLLQYEGTTMQQRRQNYYPTNMSCFICQKDFGTMDTYEEHIQTHNDENEFEYLKELNRFNSPIFSVSYRLCKNSHHFCFTIETKTSNLVIEKIIIVQSRSMFYVHNMRVPYDMPETGCDNFYVDSHLFAIFVEQPIVLVSHLKDSKDTRIIEEHHFMRAAEFPKVDFVIKPSQLPSKKTFKPKFKLPDYFPPMEIRDALKDDFVYEKLMKTSNEFRDYIRNQKVLQPQIIGPTLTTLLHIEDMDTIKDYLTLLQHNVKLRSFGDDYSMRLRPKNRIYIENVLSVFDDVIITTREDIQADSESLVKLILQNSQDLKNLGDTYIGHIEDVNSGRVCFKCYKKLDLHRTYTIVFRPSRLQLRYQYRAMELLQEIMPFLNKFLFPAQLPTRPVSTMSLELYNKSIYNNPEQLQAVRNIAEGPRNDATYIIFGPPGTGKTTTLVESIMQVLKREGTQILVTASSNSACDEVALRLCKTLATVDMARAIVRIYAQSNEARTDTIDDVLLEHSNMYSVHFYPDVDILHEYRIVVCTMAVVAKLSTGKFGRRENGGMLYTHLFIDEVAASTEVEALMAITSVLTPKACLIIAGDHKQLGPIVKSKRAEEFNLAVSLMDRLLVRECYRVNTDTGDYDRTIQTRLTKNFRSHPAIVNLYSGMYYNHDLEAMAKIDDVSLVKNWHRAPSKDFPIIFHSIHGKSYSDNQSFSLYNSDEINTVMDYVKDLMYFGINGKSVRESDIGIISPYKKQYLRIREELNLRKWYQIETGSVETFQGKEKSVIIVSFVRSGTSTLGFLENPRRLNVTLSRARALLILIGNARTLSINPDYDYIIKECQRHHTLIGGLDNQGGNNRNNRYKKSQGNDESSIDDVNKTLKDLKLKNNNENSTRPKRNQKRPPHAGKKDKENRNQNNNDSDDDDDQDNDDNDNDDDDDDNNDNDNKPSTSKAAGKSNLSQPMKKKNQQQHTRGPMKKTHPNANSNRREKQNGKFSNKIKDNEKTKTNLEAFFDELPNVPKTAKAATPNNGQLYANQQIPSLMTMPMQRPPAEAAHNHQTSTLNPYFMQQQQQHHQFLPPQHMGNPIERPQIPPNVMGLPPGQQMHQQQWPQQPNYMGIPRQQHNNQQQWPQPPNSMAMSTQQLLQQWSMEQLQWQQLQQNTQQQKNQLESTLAANAVSESKRAARRRANGKTSQTANTKEKNANEDEDDDDEVSTSKAVAKPHLAHSMKKKNQNQTHSVAKVSKALKTVGQNTSKANVATTSNKSVSQKARQSSTGSESITKAKAGQSTTGSESITKSTPHIDRVDTSVSQKAGQPSTGSQPIPKATPRNDRVDTSVSQNAGQTSTGSQPIPKVALNELINTTSVKKTSKVIGSISGGNPSVYTNAVASNVATARTTNSPSTSTVNSASFTKYSPDTLRALRPAATASASQTTGVQTSQRTPITPTAIQYSSSQANANRTTNTSSSSSISQYSSTSLNRTAAAVKIYPTLNQNSNLSATVSDSSVAFRASVPATNPYYANNNASYARSSSQREGVEEALHYNQPHRPIRQFHMPEAKEESKCVIA